MEKVYIKILLALPIRVSQLFIKIWRRIKYWNGHTIIKSYKDYFKEISVNNIRFNILLSHTNGTVDDNIHQHGIWDEYVLNVLKRYLKRESVFVDVGANIGFFSLYASNICNKVIAFEPVSVLHNQFTSSITKNGIKNIDLRMKACGARSSHMKIELMRGNMGASSFVRNSGNVYESKIVEVVTLDSCIGNQVIDLIKIDVEGFEPEVFNGAKKIIRRCKPIIVFEFSPILYEDRQCGLSLELLELLDGFGYDIFDTKSYTNVRDKDNFIKELMIKSAQSDLLCVPKNV